MAIMLTLLAGLALALLIAALASYMVTRPLISGVTKAYALAFKRRPSGNISRVAFGLTWLVLFFLIPLKACNYAQVRSYKNAIPVAFEISEVIFHDEQSDLREGCGVAVFKLSDKTLAQIDKQGLEYFSNATLGRDLDGYHRYHNWQTTPPMDEAHLLRGEQCAGNRPLIWGEIRQAARREGAYYTVGREQDLVVIPRLGVLIFSFSG